jgi:hypothetical protein
MPSFKSTIEFDAKSIADFKKQMLRIASIEDREKLIIDACKSAVKPWQAAMRNKMYTFSVQRRTGKMAKSIGIRKYQDKRSGRVGAQVGPSGARRGPSKKGGAGWRVHFFATPARQMDPQYQIPFQEVYSSVNRGVTIRIALNMRILIDALKKNNRNPEFLP